jgi:hypothetical protein
LLGDSKQWTGNLSVNKILDKWGQEGASIQITPQWRHCMRVFKCDG